MEMKIKTERSPFHKQRYDRAPRGSNNLQTQVSQDIFDDFMLYARHYNAQHPSDRGLSNKANPLKHIVTEFLNSHAIERKSYSDLYVIMAFNRIDFQTPFNTDVKGAVIGFVRYNEKFTTARPFLFDVKYKKNINYYVEEFDRDLFELLNLGAFDKEVLFNINPSLHSDFDAVRVQLQKQHSDIDFDNAHICMFNLNNYLDILQDGVYVSERSTYSHDGFVVLFDPDDIYKLDRVVLRFSWSYTAGVFKFKADVETLGHFNTKTVYHVPREVWREYWATSSGFLSERAKLELNIKHYKQRIESFNESIEQTERALEKAEQKLDKLKD